MSRTDRLHLGAFMRPVSIHTAWWRYPSSAADANFNLQHIAFANAVIALCMGCDRTDQYRHNKAQ